MQIRVHSLFLLFLLQISAIGQMLAHLTNFVRILSLLVGLTKCTAHLGKRARVWPIVRVIGQTLRNWSNALRDCPNAQIGQMRLTVSFAPLHWCRW